MVDSSFARSQGNVVIVTAVLHLQGMQSGKPYLRYGRYLDTWVANGRPLALRIEHDHPHAKMTTQRQPGCVARANPSFRVLLLCLCCAMLPLSAGAVDGNADVANTMLSLERLKFDAQQRKDVTALDGTLDDTVM